MPLLLLYVCTYFLLVVGADREPEMGLYPGAALVSLVVTVTYLHLVRNLPLRDLPNGPGGLMLRALFVSTPMVILLAFIDKLGLTLRIVPEQDDPVLVFLLASYVLISALKSTEAYAVSHWPRADLEKRLFPLESDSGLVGKVFAFFGAYAAYALICYVL